MAFIGITIKFSKLDRQHYRSSQVPCAESKLQVDNLHLRSLILGKSIFIKQFYPIHELIYYYGYLFFFIIFFDYKDYTCTIITNKFDWNIKSESKKCDVFINDISRSESYDICNCHFNDNNMGWCECEKRSPVRVLRNFIPTNRIQSIKLLLL